MFFDLAYFWGCDEIAQMAVPDYAQGS